MDFKDSVLDFLSKMDIKTVNVDLYLRAFTHASYVNENGGDSYERLEYFGDAILKMVMVEELYHRHANSEEGELSKMCSYLCSLEALNTIAKKWKLFSYVRLGKGESASVKIAKKLGSDLLEAFFAALYLDLGLSEVKRVILFLYEDLLLELDNSREVLMDYKTRLQEKSHELYKITPTYKVEAEKKTKRGSVFSVSLWIGQELLGQAEATTKKQAELMCAKLAIDKIGV